MLTLKWLPMIPAVLLLSSMAIAAQLTGEWAGTITIGQNQIPLRAHLDSKGGKVSGTVTLPTEGLFSAELQDFHQEKDAVSFSAKIQGGVIAFSGVLSGPKLAGQVTLADAKGTFDLLQTADVTPEKYFGIYELDKNHRLYIRTWDELGENQLTFYDDSGRVGPLYAISETDFFSGPGIWLPLPERIHVTFTKHDQGIDGLLWKEEGWPKPKAARKLTSIKEEEIVIRSGDFRLGGSLVTPPGPGPHPAVILVHGSGPVSRDFLGPFAYWFAAHGIAAVTYDKRGIGKSEGNWLEQNFNDLAGDVLAAVAFLKARPDIDSSRIGLLGASQGGWIVPLVASQSMDVGFAILISASAVTPAEQDIQSVEEEMKVAGSTTAEIEQTIKKERSDLDSIRSEDAAKEFAAEIAKLKDGPDKALLTRNSLENPLFLLFFRNIMDFDPSPFLQKTKCPVIAFYGELDRGVPLKSNRDKLEALLKEAGNTDVKIVVLPAANHVLFESKTGSRKEFPYLNHFAPGFLPALDDWLKTHVSK